jgi:uncharacterized membrane protein YphA (DoxX/SURF4 family)
MVNIALWIAQVLVAVLFMMSGVMKTFMPIEELMKNVPWAADVPTALVRFIGASELAGALGVILPAATRIKPMLTPLAAAGITTIMVLACAFHGVRGETAGMITNVVLGLPAAFVAWGRFRKVPIAPRGKAA